MSWKCLHCSPGHLALTAAAAVPAAAPGAAAAPVSHIAAAAGPSHHTAVAVAGRGVAYCSPALA